jgi:hypothetical protein
MDGTILALDVLDDPPGVEVIDQLERLRYQLWTDSSVSPTPADSDAFHFPVSNAFEMTARTLSVPATVSICLRDDAGGMIADVGHLEEESVADGEYIIELGAQIKTYIEVEGPIEITSDLLEKEIAFGQARVVRVGVRSRHERPAATVTTTEDPRDMMAAVSTFGSALKSQSPERSYPTLRGHPPSIEIGDTLDVPAVVQPPETDVRIEIPETYEAIFTAAPLAYYLGAELQPGTAPRLVTDDGFAYALDQPDGLEDGVARTLKQLFTLDCVTRVDGLYNIELHERNVIEQRVGLDFASLYSRPLSEQVAVYLSVPYEKIDDCIPTWRLTTHVRPEPSSIEQLPYVVNDLSLVRIPETLDASEGPANVSGGQTARGGTLTRSTATGTTRATTERTEENEERYVEPATTDSLEQAWIGDGIPIGATKLTKQAFENWFEREKVDGDISITILVNDDRMNEEGDIANEVYGDRDDLPFDISVRNDLSVAELRATLSDDHSFLHYVGHIEEEGFKCSDGMLDAATLDSTGIDAFMLNACSSYRQGLNLINAGAVGGIVTLNDIINEEAIKIGETVAYLLNAGFPLDTSLSIAREQSALGGQYIIVGTGEIMITQQPGMVPFLVDLHSIENDAEISIMSYVNKEARLGTIFTPFLNTVDGYSLASRILEDITISRKKLKEFVTLQPVPIQTKEGVYIDLNELTETAASSKQ